MCLRHLDPANFAVDLQAICRRKISELFKAVLEAEVDDVLERLRYEHRSTDSKAGYRRLRSQTHDHFKSGAYRRS